MSRPTEKSSGSKKKKITKLKTRKIANSGTKNFRIWIRDTEMTYLQRKRGIVWS